MWIEYLWVFGLCAAACFGMFYQIKVICDKIEDFQNKDK